MILLGKRSEQYKFKPTEELGSIRIEKPEEMKVKQAWGDFPSSPSMSPPPDYYGVHDPPLKFEEAYFQDLRDWTPSPADRKSVDLMFSTAMESLKKIEATVERIKY